MEVNGEINEDERSRVQIQRQIEWILCTMIQDLGAQRSPYFEYRSPLSNKLKKLELYFEGSQKKFVSVFVLMHKVYELVLSGQRQNKRDIFYEYVSIFNGVPKMLDEALINLSLILKVPRWKLRIDASSKGLVAGNLKWKDENNKTTQIKPSLPTLIPSNQTGFHDFESDAKYILIVEKDAIYVKLMQENCFSVLGPFLLVTGKGYPDYATRRLVRKLWESLKIPVLILVDANFHGLRIAATYRWGSQKSIEPELRLPEAQLIGVLPSEVDYVSPNSERILMTDREVKRLDSFEKRLTDDNWKKEVQVLRRTKRKAEIEDLTNDSSGYLTQVYLPSKIARFTTPA